MNPKDHQHTDVLYNKYLQPQNTPISGGSLPISIVPWQFSVNQGIQAKKVRASTGQFKNISGTLGTANIMGGTVNQSLVENGSVANNIVTGATISASSFTGGTLLNNTVNTGTINTSLLSGGTGNNLVLGTPNITGGTSNAGTYQTGGTGGVTGSIIYVKTVSGPTFGTLSFTNGLITSFN